MMEVSDKISNARLKRFYYKNYYLYNTFQHKNK